MTRPCTKRTKIIKMESGVFWHKAKKKLGWTPKISFDELVAEMVREDFKAAERDELIKKHGYKAMDYHE